jgi:hypothetical protein
MAVHVDPACLARISFGLVLLASAAGCGGSVAPPPDPPARVVADAIALGSAARTGIPELSGLAVRREPGTGRLQVVAIGDRRFDIAIGDWNDSGGERFETVEAALMFEAARRSQTGPSQWEAVATDGSGAVIALREDPAELHAFDPRIARLTHVVGLRVPRSTGFASDWDRDPNARGEGLVLLRRGHVLVLKEKQPIALVEFGPAGEAPLGLSADTRLGDDATFELPASSGGSLDALKVWRAGSSVRDRVPDLSDLALDSRGRLYTVSDEASEILLLSGVSDAEAARFTLLPSSDSFRAIAAWRLPSQLPNVEGLAFSSADRPIVARDNCRQRDTCVFEISTLLAPPRSP